MNHVDNPFESPAVISFCPGILGLERGLERVIGKIRVVSYVEIEAFIIANLVAGMETGVLDPAPVWTDAKTFDARPFRGKIHGIIGGYPCPGESLAGLREGHLYKGFIWPAIRRAIAAARPIWCFFENVDDHLTGTYPIVQRSLRNMGYAVEAGIYTAKEAGAPQDRQRLFILAILVDSKGTREWGKTGNFFKENERQNQQMSIVANSSSKELGNSEGNNEWRARQNATKRSIPSGRSNKELADTSSQGSQGLQPGQLYGSGEGTTGSASKCRPQDFPLGQGFEQWGWEEPREIESRLEYSIAGYQFENDLLRAIGNSVVSQTAEIAFNDLLKKHFT